MCARMCVVCVRLAFFCAGIMTMSGDGLSQRSKHVGLTTPHVGLTAVHAWFACFATGVGRKNNSEEKLKGGGCKAKETQSTVFACPLCQVV